MEWRNDTIPTGGEVWHIMRLAWSVPGGIEYPQRRVTVAGRTVALTIIEYRMLVELSANAGRPLTHEHLLQRVWGPDKGQDPRR